MLLMSKFSWQCQWHPQTLLVGNESAIAQWQTHSQMLFTSKRSILYGSVVADYNLDAAARTCCAVLHFRAFSGNRPTSAAWDAAACDVSTALLAAVQASIAASAVAAWVTCVLWVPSACQIPSL